MVLSNFWRHHLSVDLPICGTSYCRCPLGERNMSCELARVSWGTCCCRSEMGKSSPIALGFWSMRFLQFRSGCGVATTHTTHSAAAAAAANTVFMPHKHVRTRTLSPKIQVIIATTHERASLVALGSLLFDAFSSPRHRHSLIKRLKGVVGVCAFRLWTESVCDGAAVTTSDEDGTFQSVHPAAHAVASPRRRAAPPPPPIHTGRFIMQIYVAHPNLWKIFPNLRLFLERFIFKRFIVLDGRHNVVVLYTISISPPLITTWSNQNLKTTLIGNNVINYYRIVGYTNNTHNTPLKPITTVMTVDFLLINNQNKIFTRWNNKSL